MSPMSFGPAPWRQTHWDARAAGNFVCGGAGAGLIAFGAIAGADRATLTWVIAGGLALVALGLICVWLEIGRPLRALNVFLNLRTSWMSREALTATLLFPLGVAVATGVPGAQWAAAALAFNFVYCQGRMLQGAKGIPAWREPLVIPLIVTTGLTEGAGLFLFASALRGVGTPPLLAILGALVIGRIGLWLAYRRKLNAAPGAITALDKAGWVLQVAGTLVPLALLVLMAFGGLQQTMVPAAAMAGLAAAFAGAHLKLVLVTRAGFNQGFAIAHLPVRGARF
jgi:phenylacetyl-CoA:acceptor oxidoreductase subunit 2